MEPISVICILIGIAVIVNRGPLIFAPKATLRFYDRLISSNAGLRVICIGLLPLAVPLIALPLGDRAAAVILHLLGWLWAAVSLWLFAAPNSYARLARGVLGHFESSLDDTALRVIGLLAVAIGVTMVYFGLYVA